METVYLICGAAGVTVLVIQFIMTLIGLDTSHDFDVGHAEAGADAIDISGDHDLDVHADTHLDGHGHAHEAGSTIFSMLSIRTVTAAFAFFGLGGLAANSIGLSTLVSLPIAIVAGFLALYIVAWIMRVLYGLRSEGNVYIECALGSHGTVYLAIPGEEAGLGKVLVNVQDRTMEYDARTTHGPLATGTPVVVVDIVDSNTVQVEPAESSEGN